jgi:hypothetical protein
MNPGIPGGVQERSRDMNPKTDQPKSESPLDQWRRIREETTNPPHWKKPRKDPRRPTVAETVAEIRKHQQTEGNRDH